MNIMLAACSGPDSDYGKLQVPSPRTSPFQLGWYFSDRAGKRQRLCYSLGVPYPKHDALDAVVRRRLFFSPEADRFEPVHRTVAEFLAAEDLSKRIAERPSN